MKKEDALMFKTIGPGKLPQIRSPKESTRMRCLGFIPLKKYVVSMGVIKAIVFTHSCTYMDLDDTDVSRDGF